MTRYPVHIDCRCPAAAAACLLMVLSAALRLWYYLAAPLDVTTLIVHLCLPVGAAVLFAAGHLAGGRFVCPCSMGAVVMGVVFFLLKAFTFAPLHQALCTLLYLTVLTLYLLTIGGFLPARCLLFPLFGLPLAYHILVEDTQLYVFADPPVPVWEWLPELSVLCIMAALLAQAWAIKVDTAGKNVV